MMKAVQLIIEEASARRCNKYPCQIIQYKGAFLKCLDVKEQVLTEIKVSSLFSLQLDESTDKVHVLSCLSS